MVTLSEIRQGLSQALTAVPGLRVSATMQDAPNPPVAMVYPDLIQYDLNANRGADEYTFVILLIVGRAADRAAQNNIDQYAVGHGSVKAAVEADRTLGGIINTCRVSEMRNYQQLVIGDTTFLSVEFVVEVVA